MYSEDSQLEPEIKLVATAAIYARYSSEMQSSASARDQIGRIEYMISKDQVHPLTFPNARVEVLPQWVLKDEAVSGKVAGRHGYQAILQGIRARAFNLLIVDDLSRLTRSLGNLLELYQLLKYYDIELISVSDRVSSADPNARTFFTVKGMVADFGNEAHSERTVRGLESRARDLFSTGQKPYGYGSEATRIEKRKGKEVKSHFKVFIIPEQARVIRQIFKTYAEGHGKKYIAKLLNSEKVPTPTTRSLGWKEGIITNILSNEKYVGQWAFKKKVYSIHPDTQKLVSKIRPRSEWLITPREDLRIVDQETWDIVKAKLKANKIARRVQTEKEKKIFGEKNRIDNLHLLSGAMVCSECGMAIVLVSGRRDGYYGCLAAHRQGTCSSRYLLRRRTVETAFVEFLQGEVLSNEAAITYATESYNQMIKSYMRNAPSRKKDVEAEHKKLALEISNLVRFIAAGNAGDLETVTEAIRERENRKVKLEEEMTRLSENAETKLLVTPHLVRDGLNKILGSIIDRGNRYNEDIRKLIYGSLSVTKKEEGIELLGTLNLGASFAGTQVQKMMGMGSTSVRLGT